MLQSLHIENFALIESLDVEFPDALTIITGETGAGKSIILGALSMLTGARADTDKLRDPSRRMVVEAVFTGTEGILASDGKDSPDAQSNDTDEEDCDGTLILRRELSPSGRSRAFINDSPATLKAVGEMASRLIDIHSQHSNPLLSSPAFRLRVIDALADNAAILAEYRAVYSSYAALRRALRARREETEQAREKREVIAFRLERLRELKPRAGEQAQLERRLEVLSAAEQIRATLGRVCRLLEGGESAALPLMHEARTALADVSEAALPDHPDEPSLAERLQSAEIEVRDIADTLHDALADVEADPAMLQRTEQRLEAIYNVEKYLRIDSDTGLVAEKERLERLMAEISGDDGSTRELEARLHAEGRRLKEAARRLTASRKEAAVAFAQRLVEKARPLGLANLTFEVAVETAPKMTSDGADTVVFRCSFNKNQPLRPAHEIASGGEISRLMLCVKAIVARRMQLPTVIFDEVDTGVSGDIADRMGRMMRDIASGLQVIAITHLPQVAVMGATHFKVYKEDDAETTLTHVARLTPDEREREIARMLSGSVIDEAALMNARSLLGSISD